MGAFRISLDLQALDQTLSGMQTDCDQAARPASQAMAQVLYDEVKSNVGRIGVKTGNLRDSIYQAFSADDSSNGRAVYHVSWNARKAPHGGLIEFGYMRTYAAYFSEKRQRWVTNKRVPIAPKRVAARPFLRPAIVKFPAAQEAGVATYLAELKARGVVR